MRQVKLGVYPGPWKASFEALEEGHKRRVALVRMSAVQKGKNRKKKEKRAARPLQL